MSIRLALYGLGYGKDILVPFKEARPMEKENAIWSTFIWMKTNRLVAQVRRINF
jgi:hypothetical protein